jgi:hypothetical protein
MTLAASRAAAATSRAAVASSTAVPVASRARSSHALASRALASEPASTLSCALSCALSCLSERLAISAWRSATTRPAAVAPLVAPWRNARSQALIASIPACG